MLLLCFVEVHSLLVDDLWMWSLWDWKDTHSMAAKTNIGLSPDDEMLLVHTARLTKWLKSRKGNLEGEIGNAKSLRSTTFSEEIDVVLQSAERVGTVLGQWRAEARKCGMWEEQKKRSDFFETSFTPHINSLFQIVSEELQRLSVEGIHVVEQMEHVVEMLH